ncbi:MAG: hypothetical protein LBC19_01340 [Tannerella sp.]|jgi:hypothetical protein|nr:hypothetical protein [Tannerella sp.]
MKTNTTKISIFILLFAAVSVSSYAQDEKPFRYSGQLSGWAQFAPDISLEGWLGGRYIPQLNCKIPLKNGRLLDFEVSANLFGDMGFSPFDSLATDSNLKPYRAWMRYSSNRMELRAGLQKINFGSAQMFRPLMWFDQIDPRDPLQLTDGVWGVLFRYYFQNNTNLWLWGLYGNKNVKGFEITPVNKRYPEGGGRLQIPIPYGETGLSYHFRMTDATILQQPDTPAGVFDKIGENRLGFDMRLDVVVGLWLEASWTKLNKNLGTYTNQEMATLGGDYTFGIGNGLTTTFEQLLFSYDRQPFGLANVNTFSGLSLSYPVAMIDNISAMTYYDWTNNDSYIFLNWKRQFNRLTLYLMGYWNPKTYVLPGQSAGNNRFAGKGLQVMLVWNH